jgi:F-type H+-transporting ATPase subunit a
MNFRALLNPLEQFELLDLLSISIMGYYKISLTNIGLYLAIATLLIAIVAIYSVQKSILADKNSIVMESTYDSILSIVKDQIGGTNERYLPFIFSLFIFILFSNLIGLVPYSFTATSQIVLALSFSVAIFIGVTILGFQYHSLAFFSLFVPTGTPLALVPLLAVIELISYLARALSLGIRLAANMISGHILLKILSTFIWKFMISSPIAFIVGAVPVIIFTALVGLELAVAILQAIVFIILTSSYIKDAVYLH